MTTKHLFINGHNVRKGWCLILESTGECVAHLDMRLSDARRIVDRFNRIHRRAA